MTDAEGYLYDLLRDEINKMPISVYCVQHLLLDFTKKETLTLKPHQNPFKEAQCTKTVILKCIDEMSR